MVNVTDRAYVNVRFLSLEFSSGCSDNQGGAAAAGEGGISEYGGGVTEEGRFGGGERGGEFGR